MTNIIYALILLFGLAVVAPGIALLTRSPLPEVQAPVAKRLPSWHHR